VVGYHTIPNKDGMYVKLIKKVVIRIFMEAKRYFTQILTGVFLSKGYAA